MALAVNPVNGNVDVVGSDESLLFNKIYELTSSGKYTGNTYIAPPSANGLAVNASGDVYAATMSAGTIEFTSPGSNSTVIAPGQYETVAVDASTGDVFSAGDIVTEYDSAGSQIGPDFGREQLTAGTGIGIAEAPVPSVPYMLLTTPPTAPNSSKRS